MLAVIQPYSNPISGNIYLHLLSCCEKKYIDGAGTHFMYGKMTTWMSKYHKRSKYPTPALNTHTKYIYIYKTNIQRENNSNGILVKKVN